MTALVRPGGRITNQQKEINDLKNFGIFNQHLQRQLHLQQEIRKSYQNQIKKLQVRKQELLNLIQMSISSKDKNNTSHIKIEQSPIKFLSQKKEETQKQQLKMNKSQIKNKQSLLTRSKLFSKKQVQKNYLENINEFKHRDLVEEIQNLYKQLNSISTKSQIKETNQSILMQSKIKRNQIIELQTLKNDLKQYFIKKNLLQIGQIQKLPAINPSQQSSDEVLNSLLANLKKQEQILVKSIFENQQLLIKKTIKQKLQQKTIQNLRIIYKQNKKIQLIHQNRSTKSNQDIIKYGYTQKMERIIKQSKKRK